MGISHTTDLIAASPRQRCCKDGSSHSQPAERPWEHLHCSHSPKQSPCKVQNSRLWRATRLLERYREGNHPRSGSRCAACACGLPITIHPENPHRDVHRKRGNVQRHVHLCWKKRSSQYWQRFASRPGSRYWTQPGRGQDASQASQWCKEGCPQLSPRYDWYPLLMGTFNYMSCELSNDTSSKIDFFGLNSYSWCGDATFESSGYDVLVADFGNTTIPIFFSEYGCNNVSPRTFTEVPALYGKEMTSVFSGGLIYEYSEEPNNYGLVNLNDNGTVSLLVDYDNLRTQYDSLDIGLLEKANATATSLTPPSCAVNLLSGTNFTMSFNLPDRPNGVDALIKNGVSGNSSDSTNAVTNTEPSQTVYATNGQEISGLQLTVLDWDQSNLPGNNTSGTTPSSPSSTTSGSSPSNTNTAAKVDGIKFGALLMGALGVGIYMQL